MDPDKGYYTDEGVNVQEMTCFLYPPHLSFFQMSVEHILFLSLP